jgi:hypothetical protein
MKTIWIQCWTEFCDWFSTQWKYAWDLLKQAIITMVLSVFEWLKTVIGDLGLGLWKLVIKPVGKYLCDAIIELINKI